jgi:hypothetical protein
MLPTKMAVTILFVFLTVAGLATGRNFKLQNNLEYTIWVGILGNTGKGQPDNGGFALNSGQHVSKGLKMWVWNLVCQCEEVTLRLLGKLD